MPLYRETTKAMVEHEQSSFGMRRRGVLQRRASKVRESPKLNCLNRGSCGPTTKLSPAPSGVKRSEGMHAEGGHVGLERRVRPVVHAMSFPMPRTAFDVVSCTMLTR